ncbi:MAG: PIN domain-containing protein [Rubrivivax sp.]|nr:MAG: PIN domain-containing protein [Rubrivivax sp.]
MGSIDTNVLIRCIIQDDQRQCDAVDRLRKRYVQQGERLFVPVTVLLECEWVLRSCFSFEKHEIIDAMSRILHVSDFFFDKELAIVDAVDVFKFCDADFADCVHARISAWERLGPLYTFDRRASKLQGAELLDIKVDEPRPAWRMRRHHVFQVAQWGMPDGRTIPPRVWRRWQDLVPRSPCDDALREGRVLQRQVAGSDAARRFEDGARTLPARERERAARRGGLRRLGESRERDPRREDVIGR